MKIKLFFICLFLVLGVRGLLAQEPRLVLPVGHTGFINSAIFSPDGKLILTKSTDGTVKIYELNSGKELSAIIGESNEITIAEFSPNSKLLVLVERFNNFAKIYEVTTGKLIRKLMGHTGWVMTANFSPDGKSVLTSSKETARIFDVESGNLINTLNGHKKDILSAKFSPNGKLVLTTSIDSSARIFNIKLSKEIKIIKHKDWVKLGEFSPNSRYILTSSYDNIEAKLYDILSDKELHLLNSHYDVINSIQFSKDSKWILTSSNDNTARVYEVVSGIELLVLKGHEWMVTSAFFSNDDKLIITASNDNTARIWEVTTGKVLQVLSGHTGFVSSAVFSPDGKLALTASMDKTVGIYQVNTGVLVNKICGQTCAVESIEFSPDNNNILTANNDATARINNKNTGIELIKLIGHKSSLNTAKYSSDGEQALTTSWDKTAKIYNIKTGHLIKEFIGHTENISYAELNHDGKLVVTASFDTTARIWSVESGKELMVFKGHKDILKSVRFCPNSDLIISSSQDSTARIWQVKTGKELRVLRGHSNWINSAVFSPDGKLVLTASVDGTARVWQVETGRLLQILSENVYEGSVESAVFSADGKLVLLAGSDGTVSIWELSSGRQLKLLNGHLYNVKSAIFSLDSKHILTTGDDHRTILWDAATGRPLYTRLQLKNNDWLVYDEHYRYDGSQGARDYLYFVCGLEVVDLAQVKDALYVPNLVQRIMNGENLGHLPKLKDLEICEVTPEVEPLDKKDGGHYYKIKPRKGGIGQVEIYINGMLRQTLESKTLVQKDGIYELKVGEKLIQQYQIADKETEIKVIARTADNKISSRGVIVELETETKTYRKPSLHAIMIGIDDYKGEGLDLNYAAKDAIDLQTVLEKSAKKFFNSDDTNRVHFYPLTLNRTGTIGGLTPDRNNILQTIDKIAKNSKPEDVLLLFFAGHGEVNKDNNFMLLTADAAKEQAPNYMGISMKELLEKLATVPAGKRVLILDACHSGAAINELNLKDIAGLRDGEDAEKQSQRLKQLENLASKSGLAIITASSSSQKAMELPQYEHGLMTYALLSTMLNSPEVLDKNANLQLEDWLRETEKAVAKLIENQSAQRFVPLNFSLGKVDQEVRNSINLNEIPTLVVANVLNIGTGVDDLEIKSKLKQIFETSAARNSDDKILLAERENTNSVSVNITYESEQEKINCRITLTKNKVILKQFTFSGLNSDLKVFTKVLGEEILKNISK